MGDQLDQLRQRVANGVAAPPSAEVPSQFKSARVLAIASGKGGVGKTNVVVNLSISLAKQGHRVLVLDADLGLANVDVLLGIAPPHTLWHAIYGQLPLSEVIFRSRYDLQILAGASGVEGLADLPDSQRELLLKRLSYLEEQYDFLIIDCGAGVDHNVLGFTCAADEVLLVCTPEPTAVMDVYGLVKLIHRRGGTPKLSLIMNQVERASEGQNAADSICDVADKFLNVTIGTQYFIPRDPGVVQAVKRQQPIVECLPTSPAARALTSLAQAIGGMEPVPPARIGFFQRVGQLMSQPPVRRTT
ncbi:MAG: MinD/ParA family protein [bacterium]